jgi:hypothetical protein
MPLIESQASRPLSASAFRWLGQNEIEPFSLLMPFQRIERTLERIALLAGRCQLLEQPAVLPEQAMMHAISAFRSSADSVSAGGFGKGALTLGIP